MQRITRFICICIHIVSIQLLFLHVVCARNLWNVSSSGLARLTVEGLVRPAVAGSVAASAAVAWAATAQGAEPAAQVAQPSIL